MCKLPTNVGLGRRLGQVSLWILSLLFHARYLRYNLKFLLGDEEITLDTQIH